MYYSNQYGNNQSFDDWYSRYYGSGSDGYSYGGAAYGYRPQNYLSDLVSHPRKFTYTNQNLQSPQYQQAQATNYQPMSVITPLARNYEVIADNGSAKFMDEGTYNRHVSNIDNAGDAYSSMDAYRRLMRGLG